MIPNREGYYHIAVKTAPLALLRGIMSKYHGFILLPELPSVFHNTNANLVKKEKNIFVILLCLLNTL